MQGLGDITDDSCKDYLVPGVSAISTDGNDWLRFKLTHYSVIFKIKRAGALIKGNLRNDDEGTTTTLHIRGRLDRGFGFRRENLKVKRTILREDDGILGHYRSL